MLANAGTWGLHMGLSSNLRYQLLGGFDPIVASVLPIPIFRVYQAGIRALNNVVSACARDSFAAGRITSAPRRAAAPRRLRSALHECARAGREAPLLSLPAAGEGACSSTARLWSGRCT